MKYDLGIVVLNYMNYHDTIECVNSLLNQEHDSFIIIIIENGSGNNSYKILQKEYKGKENVVVFDNKTNMGFARGNNEGIILAREKYSCERVFVLNNDTILTSNKILLQLDGSVKPNIGIISPIVKFPDNSEVIGQKWGKNKLLRNTLKAYVYSIFGHYKIVRNSIKKRDKIPVITKSIVEEKSSQLNKSYYEIEGSAFLLTENYFKYYRIMYPKTFLYCEEINNIWYLNKVGLDAIKIKTDTVLHKKAQSTSIGILESERLKTKNKFAMHSFNKSMKMYFMKYEKIHKIYSENIE